MQTFEHPLAAPTTAGAFTDAQRAFMSRVYLWMFVGLGVTGATAFATTTSEELFSLVMRNYLVLMIAQLGLVFALSFFATRLSAPVAGGMFLVYAVLNGLWLSGIFFAYRLGSVASAFAITAGTFGALSVYATVTKKDLSGWGTFLFIGLFGVIIASIVNLFVHSGPLGFVVSCACVVVFAGLTAYDTQKLRRYFSTAYAGGAVGSIAIVGALTLYLDFVNLFLAVLQLTGRRR